MRYYLLIFLCCLTAFRLPAQEREGIRSFHADISIGTDGLIMITEHIRVYAAGTDIRRGIFRTIPVYRTDARGRKVHVDIAILEVRKDGIAEMYKVSESSGEKKIYIGQKEVVLDPGIYNYEIVYQTRGHVGFFDGYDELYWNVTGNAWMFPIDTATAAITLPAGGNIIRNACYTGESGSVAKDCAMQSPKPGVAVFRANGPLAAQEGLTVAVAWQPGLISRPPPPPAWQQWYENNKEGLLALIGALVLGSYFFFTWRKVGKDPEQPTVVPAFRPPNNWSPALLRYLYKKRYDPQVLSVALISMAVKKQIRITKEKGEDYVLYRLQKDTIGLSTEETKLFIKIFEYREKVTVDKDQYRVFGPAVKALESSLERQQDTKKLFLKNIRQILIGLLLALVILVGYLLLVNMEVSLLLLFTLPFILTGIPIFLTGFKTFRASGCAGIAMIAFGGIFAGGPMIGLAGFWSQLPATSLLFCVAVVVATIIYVYAVQAPTPHGAVIAAQIAGFRMYLQTAEEHRLNLLTPPDRTPELFERLLPYAIALDVENEWGEKFRDVLEQTGYAPDWYTGPPIHYSAFGQSFSNRFSSSVGSAQVSPSTGSSSGSSGWSSGSSGSGSSGGGGGGGGGGGW